MDLRKSSIGKQIFLNILLNTFFTALLMGGVFFAGFYGNSRLVLIAAVLVVVILAVSIWLQSFILSKRLVNPINQMSEGISRFAEGDLTIQITKRERIRHEIDRMINEFADLIGANAGMIKKLTTTEEEILAVMDEINTSSREVSGASNEQAAAVKEIVTTMEDSDTLSRSIASKIDGVKELSDQMNTSVEEGFELTQNTLEKMDDLRKSNSVTKNEISILGERISSIWEIVNIINSVADQTKIIAFNAELEASSAGESGKNFEIVAAEIRRLADNTVASTNEIRLKINEIQKSSDDLIVVAEEESKKVQHGWEMTKKLETIFENIRDFSDKTNDSSSIITASTQQQVFAFEQILLTLKQISGSIDQLVNTAKITADSSDKLEILIHDLHQLLQHYTI